LYSSDALTKRVINNNVSWATTRAYNNLIERDRQKRSLISNATVVLRAQKWLTRNKIARKLLAERQHAQ